MKEQDSQLPPSESDVRKVQVWLSYISYPLLEGGLAIGDYIMMGCDVSDRSLMLQVVCWTQMHATYQIAKAAFTPNRRALNRRRRCERHGAGFAGTGNTERGMAAGFFWFHSPA